MKTLIINTYGGSLLLGASALGADIVGSYEDSGYGSDIQEANFPGVPLVRARKDWPAQDLSETVVLAHPPCSAFSVQNSSPTARGVDSAAFACTKHVLEYTMKNRALAIAIESVMGALSGAWKIHQQFADDHGYHIYRVLENGCMYGSQWRERFWSVFIRQGAAAETLPLTLTPRYQTVRDVIAGHEDGPSAGNLDVLLERQKVRLIEDAKLTPEEMAFFFEPQDPPHPTIALGKLLFDKKFKRPDSIPEERQWVFEDYIGGFSSGTMIYLGPDGTCPTLMGGSFWVYNGRPVSENGFKRLMGFPADYVFPEGPKKNYRKDLRTYLSKGVMPPIAEWILEQMTLHLGWTGQARSSADGSPAYQLECPPNQIADFRIRKDDWWERATVMPPLRHYDDTRKEQEREARKSNRVIVTREAKPMRDRSGAPRPVYHQNLPLRVLMTDNLGTGITDQRRRIMLEVVQGLGQPTLEQAVEACIQHPQVPILPTTARWHINQLVKSGHIEQLHA